MIRKKHLKAAVIVFMLFSIGPLIIFTSSSVTEHRVDIHEFEEVIFVTRDFIKSEHWYANFGHYSFNEDAKLYLPGSSLCKMNIKTGEFNILFEDETGTFRDPQVHYDGERVVFSYRKGGTEYFHLYETDVNGSYLRQITSGPWSDIEPTYLPDGDILFVSTRSNRWVNCWSTQVGTLYRCNPDGTGITQLSSNIEHDNTPWVLPNGQIMYTRWEYVSRSTMDFHHLWVMNPDGSKQTVLFGNQMTSIENPWSCVLIDAKPVPWSSDTVLANYSPAHGFAEHGGYPALVAIGAGPDERGAIILPEETKALKNDPRIWPGVHFKTPPIYDPYPVNREALIASRNKDILMMDYNGREKSIFTLPDDFPLEKQHIFEVRPVMKREKEPVIYSTLEKNVDYGTFILQNVYEGRNMGDVKKGAIDKLLILETMPKPINFSGGMEPMSYSGSTTIEKIIGKVPVHDDGSAHFRLPSNRAFLFIALDENDRAIQKMKSFTSAVPGEVVSCIGCHEKRTFAPVNTGAIPAAMAKEPATPEPVKGVPAVMDFTRHIQPILDRHCVSCHNPAKREGGVLLTGDHGPIYSHSYFNLMARFQVNDGIDSHYPLSSPGMVGDMNSELVRKIEQHHGDVRMDSSELRTIRYWINTGASYPGTYGALGTGMIGVRHNNVDDLNPIQNETWEHATAVIKNSCQTCHDQLMNHIIDERNLSWWSSRADVSTGWLDVERYKKAIPFSRHLIYNLTHPENSTILLAPLSEKEGGYGLCTYEKTGEPVFLSKQDEAYQVLFDAVKHSSEYLDSIKRFDMKDFVVREEYARELKRYGVINQNMKIEEIDPYVADSIYWANQQAF